MNRQSTTRASRPATPPAAMLARTVVGVALVAGLAWIGVTAVEPTVRSAIEADSVAGVVTRGDRAAAHRQQVFEQRRARFEARTPTQVAGGTHLEHPAP